MLELYEYPPTRSQRAKWALEELGLEYQSHIINLSGQQNTDDYRAIHPLGVVPVLINRGVNNTDKYTIFESVAIVLQLIDENPEKNLAPKVGSYNRAKYYQWCVFSCAELDPVIMMYFDNTLRPLEAMRPIGKQHDAKLAKYARHDFSKRAELLSNVLSDSDYLLGSQFSGADILIGHSCFMALHVGLPFDDFPILQAYYNRLKLRPAYQRAYE